MLQFAMDSVWAIKNNSHNVLKTVTVPSWTGQVMYIAEQILSHCL